jgi:hypothetical protein
VAVTPDGSMAESISRTAGATPSVSVLPAPVCSLCNHEHVLFPL